MSKQIKEPGPPCLCLSNSFTNPMKARGKQGAEGDDDAVGWQEHFRHGLSDLIAHEMRPILRDSIQTLIDRDEEVAELKEIILEQEDEIQRLGQLVRDLQDLLRDDNQQKQQGEGKHSSDLDDSISVFIRNNESRRTGSWWVGKKSNRMFDVKK